METQTNSLITKDLLEDFSVLLKLIKQNFKENSLNFDYSNFMAIFRRLGNENYFAFVNYESYNPEIHTKEYIAKIDKLEDDLEIDFSTSEHANLSHDYIAEFQHNLTPRIKEGEKYIPIKVNSLQTDEEMEINQKNDEILLILFWNPDDRENQLSHLSELKELAKNTKLPIRVVNIAIGNKETIVNILQENNIDMSDHYYIEHERYYTAIYQVDAFNYLNAVLVNREGKVILNRRNVISLNFQEMLDNCFNSQDVIDVAIKYSDKYVDESICKYFSKLYQYTFNNKNTQNFNKPIEESLCIVCKADEKGNLSYCYSFE